MGPIRPSEPVVRAGHDQRLKTVCDLLSKSPIAVELHGRPFDGGDDVRPSAGRPIVRNLQIYGR